ncbi:MAG: manganese efflux pump [Angelakisella sp.]|jgi:putative Mn2+ efflux pump MntP|nr:manganese efflux pump [Angelakisella sp.]
MELWELLLIGVGLSMDAFAVSICKGLTARQATLGRCLTAGAYFGGFQALMPLLGYLLGTRLEAFIVNVDHWIAFVLLGVIGFNMVREAGKQEEVDPSFGPGAMLPLALATSIDALAVGVTFACLRVEILPAIAIIGTTTLLLSGAGVKLGSVFGTRYKAGAELAGGVVLILMGTKILLEHTGLI